MTLSNNLERKDKFDTDLKFFISLASKLLFFNSGRMTACLNLSATGDMDSRANRREVV